MSFKKRGSSKWTDTPNYIHNTATDTITTLPADIYPTGTTAMIGLKGQMEQNGTPTPTTPIQPQECGERTGNLFDKSTISSGYFAVTAGTRENSLYYCSDFIPITATTYYFQNVVGSSYQNAIVVYDANKQGLRYEKLLGGTEVSGAVSFQSGDAYIRINCYYQTDVNTVMINEGSTALPYEPYGYKIPISSANTTTPIYLGEVETTRRIKKSTVSITNIITLSNGNKAGVFTFPNSSEYAIQQYGLCDIAEYDIARKTSGMFYINRQNAIFIGNSNDTLDTLKTIYDGCTLWYVLETPTTGIVNEPLRKIDDYADEVSGITIPTITGANTVNVDTTMKPSEITVNYKGWHPVIDVHRFNGTSWD